MIVMTVMIVINVMMNVKWILLNGLMVGSSWLETLLDGDREAIQFFLVIIAG